MGGAVTTACFRSCAICETRRLSNGRPLGARPDDCAQEGLTMVAIIDIQPGDRAELPDGESGTVVRVLSSMKRRNGREVAMIQVQTWAGTRIWASDDLASLARDLPSKVNPDSEGVVATTDGPDTALNE